MQIKRGTCRLVVMFPLLKLAVKLPLIKILPILKEIRLHLGKGEWKNRAEWRNLLIGLRGSYKDENSACGFLFRGLYENWSEFLFWWRIRHPFLQPTYFSLFGLLNLQRADKPCEMNHTDLWVQLDNLTDRSIWDDPHHFNNPGNFCFRDGGLRMHDYGNRGCQGVVIEYGNTIIEQFDPAYNYLVEKSEGNDIVEG